MNKRCVDHRLVVLSQQLLDCPPNQLDGLRCTAQNWCQMALPLEPQQATWVRKHSLLQSADAAHTWPRATMGEDMPARCLPAHSRAFAMASLTSSKMTVRAKLGAGFLSSTAATSAASPLAILGISCSLLNHYIAGHGHLCISTCNARIKLLNLLPLDWVYGPAAGCSCGQHHRGASVQCGGSCLPRWQQPAMGGQQLPHRRSPTGCL